MTADVDREAVRDALEDAYLQKEDEDVNRFELFAYASEIPPETPDDLAMSIAADVIADPPEITDDHHPAPPKTAEPPAEEPDSSPTDPGSDASETGSDDFAEHYDHVAEVYAELGEIDGDLCIGNTDFLGWYQTRSAERDEFDGQGRPWGLGREFPGMRDDLDRVLYATVNYAPSDWFLNAWRPFRHTDEGREWLDDETPTPGYDEITAYAPFADIDLENEVKQRRPSGEIPRERIEDALQKYVDAFARLAGGKEHVFALDSVGGAYVMVAPTATAPIAEEYARADQGRLFEDLTDRMNDWLDGVREEVNAAVDVEGTFEPDLLNNKNRLYKAPLSVHSSLEGVVTPIEPSAVTYEYTPLEAVDDVLVAETAEWAAEFTDDHTDAIASVVATLWPDYIAEADGWVDALDSRLEDIKSDETTAEATEERLADIDVPEGLERTDDIDVVKKAIEDINVAHLARNLADDWDTAPGRDPPRFDPSWRNSNSGTSCYADRDKFVDLEEGKKGGGALKLIARDRRIITDCRHKLEGDDYWKAVAELRKEGYEIPRFTGRKGTHPDNLGLHEQPEDDDEKRRKVLRAMKASKRS